MQIISKPISRKILSELAKSRFGNLVKAVVDVKKGIMAIDADLHADEEAELLTQGSVQSDLWGINLYPDQLDDQFVEFDSMINLRPSAGNMTRGVEDPARRQKIRSIVYTLIT